MKLKCESVMCRGHRAVLQVKLFYCYCSQVSLSFSEGAWRCESKTSLWAIGTGDHEVAWFVGDRKPHPLNLKLFQPLLHIFGPRKATDLDKIFLQLYSILYTHGRPSGMARHTQTPTVKKHCIETCILSIVKQITSPGLMYETSAQGWFTRMTQRDGMGKDMGGGFRMGNSCKSMADSYQCMAKTTTIL